MGFLVHALLFTRVFVSWAPWIQLNRILEFLVASAPLCIHSIVWVWRDSIPEIMLRRYACGYWVASVALFALTVFLLNQWMIPVIDVTHPDYRPRGPNQAVLLPSEGARTCRQIRILRPG